MPYRPGSARLPRATLLWSRMGSYSGTPIAGEPAAGERSALLGGSALRLAPGPVAEEVVDALLEQGQIGDLGRGGGAAADSRPDPHLVAGLDRADAAALGVHGRRTVHHVGMGVPVRAAQRD